MTDRITPHNRSEMLNACQAQYEHMDASKFGYGPDWKNDCQAFVHCMWGLLSGGASSAFNQWLMLDPEDRLTMKELNGDINNAPLAASLFSKGDSPNGHTWIKKRPFNNGVGAGWSTDLWKTGLVGPVANTAPHTKWGHVLLGAGLSVNGYALDLSGNKPPQPKQNKRYQRIERAHNNIGHGIDDLKAARWQLRRARDTAEAKHDEADVKAIQRRINVANLNIEHAEKEMKRLEELYQKARHA